MSTGQPLASAKSQIFESLLWFLPDWAQNTVLVLIILAVLVAWGIKLRNKFAQRRALRQPQPRPVPQAAPYEQGRGADYLGAYAPRPRPEDGSA